MINEKMRLRRVWQTSGYLGDMCHTSLTSSSIANKCQQFLIRALLTNVNSVCFQHLTKQNTGAFWMD